MLAFVMMAQGQAAEVALKLRISWGGGADRVWQGTVHTPGGSLSELTTLGIEADSPGSIWLDGDNTVQFRQPSPRAYDGIDVMLRADSESKVAIQLSAADDAAPQDIEIPVADLIEGTHNSTLDDTGNRLSVSRSPGDRLRVTFDREHLVFSPGETFAFTVEPYRIGGKASGLRCQTQILGAASGQRVSAEEHSAVEEGVATPVSIQMPQHEGVYDLMVALVPPSRIKQRLGLQKPVVQRKIQLVVVDPQPQPRSGDAPTAKVLEINPVNARWWERFAGLPQIAGFRKGPLGNGDAATWDHPTLGPMMQLGPGGTAPDISWEAYPLPVDHPGQVHVLEIEYPTNVPQAMGISILEPNAAGAVMPIGLDSGVYVSDEEAENPPHMAKHRVVFWPKSKSPLVLITNRRSGSRAVYGKIAVFGVPHSQLAVLALNKGGGGGALPPAFTDAGAGERLWAGYMDRPLVAENFGASEALDGQSNRSLDDWNTFHQAGTRLVNYLQHVGYNGLMLSVYADGSTLYPSAMLAPTPRYDTGSFFATGQDPCRKDALELLFRLFDREKLILIPALQFAAPLPELQAIKRAGGAAAVGLEWVGADGQTTLASTAQQGLAPHYNLLDPRVQAAMLDAAREVIVRYAAHPAFGGLSLQLSPEGYAQLPGAEWGFDDQTIARFEKDTKSRVPGEGKERFAARATYLTGPARATWLDWRAKVVADFHRDLEREITAAHPGGKLYLAGGSMFDSRQTQLQLQPTLPRRAKLDDAFKEVGLAVPSYVRDSNIVVLRPQLLRPDAGPPPSGAAEAELYQSREMDSLFAAGDQHGAIFHHEPQKARLASFDAVSPFGPSNTYAWLVSQMSPSGDRNRRRFVHSIATADATQMFDGGWMLSLGQEPALHDLLSVYRQLPGGSFETVAGEFQPITIRSLVHKGQTYVYLVNDSPWPASATLQLNAPADCQLEQLGNVAGAQPLTRTMGLSTWEVSLKPYDLTAARFHSPEVKVQNAVVQLPTSVQDSLERRIADLVARVRALGSPLLENPSFDMPLVNQQIAGWSARVPKGGRVLVDSRFSYAGSRSVMLGSTGPPVSLASASLVPPGAGRLTVEVWLRTAGGEQMPALRIAVEGETSSGPFSPNGVIDRVGATAAAPGDWVHYSFPIDDLPHEGLTNVRVRFELLGAGEVWIDDVQVRSFSGSELLELSKITTLAHLHLEKGQYADCARLLDGYWPQFLVANVALNTPVAQRPKPPEPQPPAPEKAPTLFETMRSYLPPSLR
jgi:hypothetical protein